MIFGECMHWTIAIRKRVSLIPSTSALMYDNNAQKDGWSKILIVGQHNRRLDKPDLSISKCDQSFRRGGFKRLASVGAAEWQYIEYKHNIINSPKQQRNSQNKSVHTAHHHFFLSPTLKGARACFPTSFSLVLCESILIRDIFGTNSIALLASFKAAAD